VKDAGQVTEITGNTKSKTHCLAILNSKFHTSGQIFISISILEGARGSVVGSDTKLQAEAAP
jgi:hypothetical protein